jgi:hypothetical protein
MKLLAIALTTVVWSTIPLKSHLDYRQYNHKLHRGAKMETRHTPVTRTFEGKSFKSNRKRSKSETDFNIQLTHTKPRHTNWKQNNRKFHKK